MSETTSAPSMSPSGVKPALAEAVPVRTAEGINLIGWAVRQDTVVVHAGGLSGHITVVLDEREVIARDLYETVHGVDAWKPLTALELPEGSLNITGEYFPPEMLHDDISSPTGTATMGARVAFWCLVFPRMRGC